MFHIGFVIFPQLTQLDFTGPLQVLHRLPESKVSIVAKTLEPVPSDCGLSLLPTTTFDLCDPLDLLCVPGGYGVQGAMHDEATVAFVRSQGQRAKYVTSVCTGAFVLGAAGLLHEKRATTHWAYHDLLSQVGAVPTVGRVVRDGNTITGGGVTAGIDFALTVVAEIAGNSVAEAIQLSIEYAPAPPFNAGSPNTAPSAVRATVDERFHARRELFRKALDTLPR